MDIFKASEKLLAMDDNAWRRHANPWSVYTRFTCLPLIALTIWSRDWIGWWSLIPFTLSLVWTWLNPRFFSEPRSLENWASKGVLGERLFLSHRDTAIATHHVHMANLLTAASAVGAVILIYGLVVLDFWAVICGLFMSIGPKVWFVDRMVWIYEDYRAENSLSENAL